MALAIGNLPGSGHWRRNQNRRFRSWCCTACRPELYRTCTRIPCRLLCKSVRTRWILWWQTISYCFNHSKYAPSTDHESMTNLCCKESMRRQSYPARCDSCIGNTERNESLPWTAGSSVGCTTSIQLKGRCSAASCFGFPSRHSPYSLTGINVLWLL